MQPTIYKILPAFKDFRDDLSSYANDDEYTILHPALHAAIKTIEKYHGKASRSSAQVVCLCESLFIHQSILTILLICFTLDLDP